MTQELGIRISVDGRAGEAGLRSFNNSLQGTQGHVANIERAASSATASLARMGHAAVTALSVRELAATADAYVSINAQLKIATGSALAGAQAYEGALRIALDSGQALSEVSNVYKRFADNATTLGMSQKQVAQATETVAQAMALSGGSAESAKAALVQFGQGLASGTLRGEELNSVLEQAPRLAKLVADGLGVPVGKLRELAEQGKITSEVLAEILQGDAAKKVATEFAELPVTIGRAMTNLKTGFTDVVGDFEKSTGVFALVASGLDGIARHMDVIAAGAGTVAAVMAGRMVGAFATATAAQISYFSAIQAQTQADALAAQSAARRAQAEQQAALIAQTQARDRLLATQAEIAADRERVASAQLAAQQEIAARQAQFTATAALIRQEIALEQSRHAAQINDTGRAQRMTAIADLSRQLAATEAAAAAQSAKLAATRVANEQAVAAAAAAGAAKIAAAREAEVAATGAAAAATLQLRSASAAAGTAMTAASGAAAVAGRLVGALGGPIGIVTTALSLGATAWMIWGDKTEQAAAAAANSASEHIDSVINKLAELNGRLTDVTRKSYESTVAASESGLKSARAEIQFIQGALDKLDAAGGKGRFSEEGKALQVRLNEFAAQEIALQRELGVARERSAEVGTAAITKFIETNAVGAEKISVKQTKLLQEFAQGIAATGGVLDLSNAAHKRAYDALNAGLADAAKTSQNGLKNDLSQIGKAQIEELRSNSKTEIELVKDKLARRLIAEEDAAEQIKAIQIKSSQDEIAALAKRYDSTKDQGERSALIAQMNEASNAAMRAISDADAAMQKLDDDALRRHQDWMVGIGNETGALLEKAAAAELELQTIGLSAEQLAVLTARRYDEQIALKQKRIDQIGTNEAMQAEVYLLEQQISALNRLKSAEVARPRLQEQAEFWRSIESTAHATFVSIADGGKDTWQRLKDTGKNIFFDWLYQMTLKKWLFNISATVSGTGMATSAMGATGDAGSWISGAQNAYSAYNGLGNIANSFGGTGSGAVVGSTQIANGVGALGGDSLGTFIDLNASNWGTTAGNSFTSTVGTGLSYAGAGLSAYGAGQYLGQKYGTAAGAVGGTAVGAGSVALGGAVSGAVAGTGAMAGASAALAAIPVWGWAAMAALAIFGASGKKPKLPTLELYNNQADEAAAYGAKHNVPAIDTAFGTLAYSGQHLKEGKIDINQLFEERLKPIASLDAAMASVMTADQYTSARSRMENWSAMEVNKGKSVIDPLEQRLFDIIAPIDGWVGSLLDTVAGTVDEKYAQAISTLAAQGATGGEEIAQALLSGITTGMDEGETLAGAFGRMAGALGQINPLFDDLGLKLYDVSLAGADAASDLIGVYGGLENLQNAFAGYYDNFYSEEEKRANTIRKIGDELASAGADLAAMNLGQMTRQQFRQMYESVVNTKGAADPLALALMRVQGAFASVTDAATSASNAAERLAIVADIANSRQMSALDVYNAALDASNDQASAFADNYSTSIQAQVQAQKSLLDAFRTSVDSIRKYRDTLALSDLSVLSPEQKYLEAQRQFDEASRLAQLGNADALASLPDVANRMLEASRGYNASGGAYAVDYAKVLDVLDKSEDVAARNAERANASLVTLERELSYINGHSASAARSLLSVDDAMAALLVEVRNSAAMGVSLSAEVVAALKSAGMTGKVVETPAGLSYTSDRGASAFINDQGGISITGKTGTWSQDWMISAATAAVSAGNTRDIYDAAWREGLTLAELDQVLKLPAGSAEEWARQNGLPAFAGGGQYQGGAALVGEDGPEIIRFSSPGQVYTAEQTEALFSPRQQQVIIQQDNRELIDAILQSQEVNALGQTAIVTKLSGIEGRLSAIEQNGSLARAA